MRRASQLLAVALPALVLAPAASAQLFANPDWKESPVPPAPEFDAKRMLEIDMPRMLDLKYGVDPKTLVVTDDGVVRYVIIAKNTGPGGAVNAFYDGVRCATGETKSYARFSGDSWHAVENPEWIPLERARTRYNLALARQALCRSGAPRATTGEMVQALRKREYLD
ncbi:CNP1-like family protein [Variovorax sp. OV329]|uniref:CNP1-like family protein n=1 Tax=Variovorax sp. OV329 TaxID=1882825 RepID=UPI0008E8B197|nr:CNP1-like family protein [Variovorax sp. OV329]SFM07560.1 CNP1-like family protein [Variovorax sp. OV329]